MITPYEYYAEFVSNYDANTLRLFVSLGLDEYQMLTVRLYGIRCPKMEGKTLERAKEIRDVVFAKLKDKWLEIRTIKRREEKHVHYLAVVYVDGECLNDWLVEQGYATRYID